MKKKLLLSIFTVGLLVACAGLASAQTASVAGEWDAAMNTPGGTRNFKLVFTVDGEKLSGTAKRDTGDLPVTGTIKGDKITFSYTVNYNGNDLTLYFAGTVKGDEISGDVTFGESGQGDSWSAKRVKVDKPKSK